MRPRGLILAGRVRATPLAYEHEPGRIFCVLRDPRPDPRCFLGIEVASRAQVPRRAPTGTATYETARPRFEPEAC